MFEEPELVGRVAAEKDVGPQETRNPGSRMETCCEAPVVVQTQPSDCPGQEVHLRKNESYPPARHSCSRNCSAVKSSLTLCFLFRYGSSRMPRSRRLLHRIMYKSETIWAPASG